MSFIQVPHTLKMPETTDLYCMNDGDDHQDITSILLVRHKELLFKLLGHVMRQSCVKIQHELAY